MWRGYLWKAPEGPPFERSLLQRPDSSHKCRWFELQGSRLVYYKYDHSVPDRLPLGVIYLSCCVSHFETVTRLDSAIVATNGAPSGIPGIYWEAFHLHMIPCPHHSDAHELRKHSSVRQLCPLNPAESTALRVALTVAGVPCGRRIQGPPAAGPLHLPLGLGTVKFVPVKGSILDRANDVPAVRMVEAVVSAAQHMCRAIRSSGTTPSHIAQGGNEAGQVTIQGWTTALHCSFPTGDDCDTKRTRLLDGLVQMGSGRLCLAAFRTGYSSPCVRMLGDDCPVPLSNTALLLLLPRAWLPPWSITLPLYRPARDCYGRARHAYIVNVRTDGAAQTLHWECTVRYNAVRDLCKRLTAEVHARQSVVGAASGAGAAVGDSPLCIPAFPHKSPRPKLREFLFGRRRGPIDAKDDAIEPKMNGALPVEPDEGSEENEEEVSTDGSIAGREAQAESVIVVESEGEREGEESTEHISPCASGAGFSLTGGKLRAEDSVHEGSPTRTRIAAWVEENMATDAVAGSRTELCTELSSMSTSSSFVGKQRRAAVVFDSDGSLTSLSSKLALEYERTSAGESRLHRAGSLLLISPLHVSPVLAPAYARSPSSASAASIALQPLLPAESSSDTSIRRSNGKVIPLHGMISLKPTPLERRRANLARWLAQTLAMRSCWETNAALEFLHVAGPSVPPIAAQHVRSKADVHAVATTPISLGGAPSVMLPGDILLFACANAPSTAQRIVTSCTWDHVAMVVDAHAVERARARSGSVGEHPDGDVECGGNASAVQVQPRHLVFFEANGDGVRCWPLVARLTAYGTGYTRAIGWRRLILPGEEVPESSRTGVPPCSLSCASLGRPLPNETAQRMQVATTCTYCSASQASRGIMEARLASFVASLTAQIAAGGAPLPYNLGPAKLFRMPAHFVHAPATLLAVPGPVARLPLPPGSKDAVRARPHYYCTELLAAAYQAAGLLPALDTVARGGEGESPHSSSEWDVLVGSDGVPASESGHGTRHSILDARAYWPNAWVPGGIVDSVMRSWAQAYLYAAGEMGPQGMLPRLDQETVLMDGRPKPLLLSWVGLGPHSQAGAHTRLSPGGQ